MRVEDVAIGFAISVVVGLLFWPRGAAAALRRRLGDAYQASASYLAASVGRLFDGGPADQLGGPCREAMTGEHLLDDAVRQFLSERAPPLERMDDVATLVAGAVRLRLSGDAVAWLGRQAEGTPRAEAGRGLSGDVEVVRAWYSALGSALAAQAIQQTGR